MDGYPRQLAAPARRRKTLLASSTPPTSAARLRNQQCRYGLDSADSTSELRAPGRTRKRRAATDQKDALSLESNPLAAAAQDRASAVQVRPFKSARDTAAIRMPDVPTVAHVHVPPAAAQVEYVLPYIDGSLPAHPAELNHLAANSTRNRRGSQELLTQRERLAGLERGSLTDVDEEIARVIASLGEQPALVVQPTDRLQPRELDKLVSKLESMGFEEQLARWALQMTASEASDEARMNSAIELLLATPPAQASSSSSSSSSSASRSLASQARINADMDLLLQQQSSVNDLNGLTSSTSLGLEAPPTPEEEAAPSTPGGGSDGESDTDPEMPDLVPADGAMQHQDAATLRSSALSSSAGRPKTPAEVELRLRSRAARVARIQIKREEMPRLQRFESSQLHQLAMKLLGLDPERRKRVIAEHLTQTQRLQLELHMKEWLERRSRAPEQDTDHRFGLADGPPAEDMGTLAQIADAVNDALEITVIQREAVEDALSRQVKPLASKDVSQRHVVGLLKTWKSERTKAARRRAVSVEKEVRQCKKEAALHRRLEQLSHRAWTRRKDLTTEETLKGQRPA